MKHLNIKMAKIDKTCGIPVVFCRVAFWEFAFHLYFQKSVLVRYFPRPDETISGGQQDITNL